MIATAPPVRPRFGRAGSLGHIRASVGQRAVPVLWEIDETFDSGVGLPMSVVSINDLRRPDMTHGLTTRIRSLRAYRPGCEAAEPRVLLSTVSPVTAAVKSLAPPGTTLTRAQVAQYTKAANTAVEAYVYGYPLLLMEATETALLAENKLPVNALLNQQDPVTAADTTVVRPNVNTLYSMSFLNLSQGPEVLSLPATQGNYVLMQILDAWTNVIAAPGTTSTGSSPQTYVIVGPNWQGALPAGSTPIYSTTDLVWILGRTGLNPSAPNNLSAVNALQAEYGLKPLVPSMVPNLGSGSVFGLDSLSKGTPPQIVQGLTAQEYFQDLSQAMVQNPAARQDAAAIRHFATIGFVPGQPFTPTPAASAVLSIVPQLAMQKIEAKEQKLGTTENRWQTILRGIGTYGVKYLDRAAVANQGLGANLPATAVYPTTKVDAGNKPLEGSNTYRIHFNANQIPPVSAFWSLTLYNATGNLEPVPQGVYTLSSYTVQENKNKSLDLYVGPTQPAGVGAANWLPSLSGPYNLTLRLYGPASSVLKGQWKPAWVRQISTTSAN
jgi:hypothetical protein